MAEMLLVNPRKRRTRRKTAAKRKTPAKRRSVTTTRRTTVTRSRRRNPIAARGVMGTVQKGAIGAAGALAVDVAMQKLPIPDQFKDGMMAPVAKGAVGLGLGMLVAKFGKNKKLGEQLADGAVTVALYETSKQMIGPSLGLSDDLLGDDLLYYGEDDGEGMEYFDDLGGFTNPAQVYEENEDDF